MVFLSLEEDLEISQSVSDDSVRRGSVDFGLDLVVVVYSGVVGEPGRLENKSLLSFVNGTVDKKAGVLVVASILVFLERKKARHSTWQNDKSTQLKPLAVKGKSDVLYYIIVRASRL